MGWTPNSVKRALCNVYARRLRSIWIPIIWFESTLKKPGIGIMDMDSFLGDKP